MKTTSLAAITFSFVTTFAGLAGSADATAPAKKDAAAKPAATAQAKPDMAAMMQQMAKYTEPNENHKKLKALVGSWDVAGKNWMAPGEKPIETKGTAEKRLVLGDRFVQEDYKGTFMGKPFVGQGLTGYDTAKAKFVNTWVDNVSTAVMTTEGTMDAAGKELSLSGSFFCPITEKQKTHRMVTRIESDKRVVLESYETQPDGKEFKNMELIYTRKN